MPPRFFQIIFASFFFFVTTQFIAAQTTIFTYQGKLTDGGTPANGSYDLQFTLWDALSGGTQQPQPSPITVTRNNVTISGGVFTVQLDFTVNAFPGADRFLEISVRPSGVGSFTILSPRQQINSTPYAIRTLSAVTADNATQLGGVPAAQYVQTNDSRLSDARPPTGGSSNYIQNTTSTQASANYNISGNGTAGGTLTGGVVNATTQYNIGGNRVLTVAGTANAFAGVGAGQANTSGNNDSFFGFHAGAANVTANSNSFFGSNAGAQTNLGSNSFFGANAGANNTTSTNSFFGADAGFSNTSGTSNAFFGDTAGQFNTTGSRNSFFGLSAGSGSLSNNLTGSDNSFFGYRSGQSNQTGVENSFFGNEAGESNSTGGDNSFFGYQAGLANTSGNKNAFFGVGAGSSESTDVQDSFFGYHAGMANNGGTNNSFFGSEAGRQTTTGTKNSFIGAAAGILNVSGSDNSFVGNAAGLRTTGDRNSFFGSSAGATNSTASDNAYFGYQAGVSSTGDFNSFFGSGAGQNSILGADNSFFGYQAGSQNTGFNNSFFGLESGLETTGGSENSFFGLGAGINNTTGSFNTAVGYLADTGSGNLNHATAIGAEATVTSSNTIMLGRNVMDDVIVGNRLAVRFIPGGLPHTSTVCFDNPGNILDCNSSSLRFKTNVQPFRSGLDIITRLRPISFNWKSDGTKDIGLAAEDVAKIAPSLTYSDEKNELTGVKYDRLDILLINAIQQQQRQIAHQQQQIQKQNSVILHLERQIKAIRSGRNRHV
ncbi:MAG TPA: tail fiber domain-containing protein [Pyrinomonadaceae bacterium]